MKCDANNSHCGRGNGDSGKNAEHPCQPAPEAQHVKQYAEAGLRYAIERCFPKDYKPQPAVGQFDDREKPLVNEVTSYAMIIVEAPIEAETWWEGIGPAERLISERGKLAYSEMLDKNPALYDRVHRALQRIYEIAQLMADPHKLVPWMLEYTVRDYAIRHKNTPLQLTVKSEAVQWMWNDGQKQRQSAA